MKGTLHPSKNRSQDGLRHLLPTFLVIDDSTGRGLPCGIFSMTVTYQLRTVSGYLTIIGYLVVPGWRS